jgi:Xaa-Pro aminopeptidase
MDIVRRLSASSVSSRTDHLVDALKERELDALLVSDLVNVRWLTGFTGSSAAVVVAADGKHRFITDFRYLTQAADEVGDGFGREITQNLLEQVAKGMEAGRLGFDDRKLSVHEHATLAGHVGEDVELVAAGGAVEHLRARKDAGELEAIRRAALLADEALEEVLARGVVGRTEQEVALDLEFTMRKRGAQAASFPPIVAAGEHGALPHAQPRDVAIPAGTLLVVDWGAMLDGYASDCTRTFATGEIDPRDAEIYELVLAAQEAALAAVAPGPTGKEVDAVAREMIAAAGHAEHFGHGLGHGVGLEIHEGPRLNQQSEEPLAEGMVVTVEPGVYVPGGVGVRIEDLVFVTADGHEVANTLPKQLRVVA